MEVLFMQPKIQLFVSCWLGTENKDIKQAFPYFPVTYDNIQRKYMETLMVRIKKNTAVVCD